MSFLKIEQLLGQELQQLLSYSPLVSKSSLNLPGPKFIQQVFSNSDRNSEVVKNLHRLFGGGTLGGSGYLSILPVDQGVEHSAGASFAANPSYFDPINIAELAVQAGCSAVASTYGALAIISKRYASKIPLIVKVNHNQLLSFPNTFRQTEFAQVNQAHQLGAAGVGCTIYFGSDDCNREIETVAKIFAQAHALGMFTVLWCYVRNSKFLVNGQNLETAADITGQANHLGVTLGADIIKQKMPTLPDGMPKIQQESPDYGVNNPEIYSKLLSQNPIDMVRYQLLNCFAGRIPLINSGGAAKGGSDLAEAVKLAVINKRAGGSGLILGRKAFTKPFAEGVELLNLIQQVYLSSEIEIA